MNLSFRKEIGIVLGLLLLTGVLYGFKLGAGGLLDPDEPFYSLTAKEMVQRHDPSTPYIFGSPQFEKPVFFYWIVYACYKIFGISEFSSRLGPCLAGILTVLITYLWGRVLFRRWQIAFISAVMLATAAQFVVLSRIVLTDMVLCLFVAAAFYCFSLGYKFLKYRKAAWLLLFVFCALGFLTKGPVGILLPFFGIIAYLILNKEKHLLKEIPWGWGMVLFSLIGLPWYALMTHQEGVWFLKHFFIHENVRRFFVAEHKSFDRFYFYPFAVFFGFFPWSLFVPGGLWYALKQAIKNRSKNQKTYLFLFLSFALIFTFFSLAKSKLLSYIFPVFPIVAFMVGAWAWRIYRALRLKAKMRWGLTTLAIFFWGIMPIGLIAGTFFYNEKADLGIFWPIFSIGCFLIPLGLGALILAWRRSYRLAWTAVVVMTVAFGLIAFGWLLPKAEAAFTSKPTVASYESLVRPTDTNFLLASKLFVRGVSFYTGDKNVGVLAENPNGIFYTQHPIPIISTREDLAAIKQENFPVYCFLRQKEFKHLKKIVDETYSITVLRSDSHRVMVKLDRD